MVYIPSEDSEFLLSILKKEISSKTNSICEMGVGSGFILSQLDGDLFGIDINPQAITETRNRLSKLNKKAEIVQSDLFSAMQSKKFDIIYFNTPYLPIEDGECVEKLSVEDLALYGGKRGNEVALSFLTQVGNHLRKNGKGYLLYSSLSHPEDIEKMLRDYLFEYKIIAHQSHFFEELFVVSFWKSQTRVELEDIGVTKIEPFSKGKHSKVIKGEFKGNLCVVKYGDAQFISKEYFFLQKLQHFSQVPKIYSFMRDFIILEYIDGVILEDAHTRLDKTQLLDFYSGILDFCYELDGVGINKFEMTNPYKHCFYLGIGKIKMIDFERSIFSRNPKNTRQFIQYLLSQKNNLKEKGIKISLKKIKLIGEKIKETPIKIQLSDVCE